MNKIFSPSRFAKYFVYDLNNARNCYLVSLLIMGFLPIIFFFAAQLFSLIITQEFYTFGTGARFTILSVTLVAVMISFPIKAYGGLTEKKIGSDWIMIPASVTEKWLSIVLTTCVVLPVCFIALLFGGDLLMSSFFPAHYGNRTDFIDFMQGFMNGLANTGFPIKFNLPFIYYLNWCENVLIFTLGAMIFRKGKVGKTILSMMLIGSVLMLLIVLICGHNGSLSDDIFMNWINGFDPQKAMNVLNLIMTVAYLVVFILLLGGLWARIKTLKH